MPYGVLRLADGGNVGTCEIANMSEKGDILLFGMMNGLSGCRIGYSGTSPQLSALNYQHEVQMEPG